MKRFLIPAILTTLILIAVCSCGHTAVTVPEENIVRVGDDKSPIAAKMKLSEGSLKLKERYKENITYKDGEIRVEKMFYTPNVMLSYKSTFYGHDSAINRDYILYGRNFELGANAVGSNIRFFLADMDGDGISEYIYQESSCIYVCSVKYYLLKGDIIGKYDMSDESTLCGVGYFNNDAYIDMVFIDNAGYITIMQGSGDSSFTKCVFSSVIDTSKADITLGDFSGDGLCDILCVYDDNIAVCYINTNAESFTSKRIWLYKPSDCTGSYISCSADDINTDSYADLVMLYKNKENKAVYITLFGRDGHRIGPDKSELDIDKSKNLYARYISDKMPVYFSMGDISEDRIPDLCALYNKNGKFTISTFIQVDEPAYDYSMDVLRTEDGYLLYSGCRWADFTHSDTTSMCDGDHIMMSNSDDGIHWKRNIEKPAFYKGTEEGIADWWSDNTLEPEVIIVDGRYHMYWQVSFRTPNDKYGDKIGYAYSDNGVDWTRKTDCPVIININNSEIGFNHEEAIYVADDKEGLCWWMYVGHFVDGKFNGYVRIRSDKPDEYDWQRREATSGLGQIGNQIGYIKNVKECTLFMRITFITVTRKEDKVTVPTFNISWDGLKWYTDDTLTLASVDTDDDATIYNRNVYFLGMSTINGTGEIEQLEDGSYKLVYVATTSERPVAPEIFRAEGGVGVMTFTLKYND